MTAAEQRRAAESMHSQTEPKNQERATSLPQVSLRQLGMLILYCSMSVLFIATIVGFWFTRLSAQNYRAPGLPDLPNGLWLSTLLIALTSLVIWQAQRAVRQNLLQTLKRWLYVAGGLASLFLLTQTSNWLVMRPPSTENSLYLATFFLLTGVHALHVIGGFVPLGFVIFHARRQDYTSSSHEGLTLCAQYWHYLGGVWLVLVSMLYLGNS